MSGIHKNYICNSIDLEIKKKNKFNPTEHQKRTMDFFINDTIPSKRKGLLLFHKVGSGKTCTSILIADKMLENNIVDKVYVFSPGSLRTNWYKEYCRICGNNDFKKFIFITYNYDVRESIKDLDFSNSLIIIDEVHNLINGVINDIDHLELLNIYKIKENVSHKRHKISISSSIYNKIHNTNNCHILALSGTPIFRNIYEFPLLMMLLDPSNKFLPKIVNNYTGQLDTETFNSDIFDSLKNGVIFPKDPYNLRKQLYGLVSFYTPDLKDFPKRFDMDPIQVYMTNTQDKQYTSMYSLEQKLRKNGYPKRKNDESLKSYNDRVANFMMATQFIISRQSSNFDYLYKNTRKQKDQITPNGWISKDILKNRYLLACSPKFVSLLVNIASNLNQKHVIYSYFLNKNGLTILESMFKLCNIKTLMFSGETSDAERIDVLNKFNNENNRYGKKYPILFITTAGAEGINLLEVNNLHILETQYRPLLTRQVIGRIIRYKSHNLLPPKDRFVKIWKYWSISSNTNSVDFELYERGNKELNNIDSFLEFIKYSSIEYNDKQFNYKALKKLIKNKFKSPKYIYKLPIYVNYKNIPIEEEE